MTETMNRIPSLGRVLVVALVLAGAGTAVAKWRTDATLPEVPADTLAQEVRLLEAHPFTLDQAATHWWRAEQPRYDAGWLIVLDVVDDALIAPRQSAQPVLQVGVETAEPINVGYLSSKVIAMVPSLRDASGAPALDLTQAPIFYGDADLPEVLDAEALKARLADAQSRGIVAVTADGLAEARHEQKAFPDDHALRLFAADLIERYAPDEVDLVEGLRVPLLGQ
jgi:hypothetical protein